jgi:hypothetical protein
MVMAVLILACLIGAPPAAAPPADLEEGRQGLPADRAAQSIAPVLSGTWRLQTDAEAARNRRAINGLSIATQLVIRQSAGEVTIESNTGTANTIVTTTYKLDGSEHAIPGPIGWDTRAKSTWDGTKLSIAIRRSVHGPEGELVFDIRETYTPGGGTLTLERSLGKTTQKLVYGKS